MATSSINGSILNSMWHKKTNSGSSLGMDDFFTLLAAQLRNQDPLSPMDNNQFMAQMAQFTMLEEMQSLSELSNTSYALSMVGKEVTVASIDSKGDMLTETGIVTGIGLFESVPVVYIGDKAYTLQQVMGVGRLPVEAKPEVGEKDIEDGGDESGGDE